MIKLALLTGIWRAALSLPGADLPFNFEVAATSGAYTITIINAEERIVVDEINYINDSLHIRLPVFDSEIVVYANDSSMNGYWINYSRKGNPAIPFHAAHGQPHRFETNTSPTADVSGRWETWLNAGTPDSSKAIGVFRQEGNRVTGTFLASGGDHRYLEGNVDGDTLWLSTFDGSHCWLYRAVMKDKHLTGRFWSGNHHQSSWHAVRNDSSTLADPSSLASVTGEIKFAFPDTDSTIVAFPGIYKGKPVILQILGSWCPNCMDESVFLSAFHKENKDVEIIGLAFERSAEFAKASNNVKRMISRIGINYPVLIAGMVGREEVMKKIPGLKNFTSYPTTIYINSKGETVKVYTGFSGPATSEDFERFKNDFYKTVRSLR